MNDLLKQIPKVDVMLNNPRIRELTQRFGPSLVKTAVQASLRKLRDRIRSEQFTGKMEEAVIRGVRAYLADAVAPSLKRVINGTGIIVHTNLGRSVLSPSVLDHLRNIGSHYCNLEYDLTEGKRGHRDVHAERLISRYFQVEAGTLVNNNAAAVMLVLNTFAEGREVVVSRGELVEIGGSFRIPEIMKKAGATLREVGTTNKTHLSDYESAIGPETGLVLKVHPSNYRVTGFTSAVPAAEIAALCRKHNIPFAEDQGSGNIHDLKTMGIHDEPTVADAVSEGIDIVTFSGDKLLGGVQAGFILGKKDLVERIKRNHLLRTLRVDKLVYAAVEQQLILYLTGRTDEIPTARMLQASQEELRNRALKVRDYLPAATRKCMEVVDTKARIGGGTTPEHEIPSVALALVHPSYSPDRLAKTFRKLTPPVIGRIEEDRFLLDMRTILDTDLPLLNEHVRALFPG